MKAEDEAPDPFITDIEVAYVSESQEAKFQGGFARPPMTFPDSNPNSMSPWSQDSSLTEPLETVVMLSLPESVCEDDRNIEDQYQTPPEQYYSFASDSDDAKQPVPPSGSAVRSGNDDQTMAVDLGAEEPTIEKDVHLGHDEVDNLGRQLEKKLNSKGDFLCPSSDTMEGSGDDDQTRRIIEEENLGISDISCDFVMKDRHIEVLECGLNGDGVGKDTVSADKTPHNLDAEMIDTEPGTPKQGSGITINAVKTPLQGDGVSKGASLSINESDGISRGKRLRGNTEEEAFELTKDKGMNVENVVSAAENSGSSKQSAMNIALETIKKFKYVDLEEMNNTRKLPLSITGEEMESAIEGKKDSLSITAEEKGVQKEVESAKEGKKDSEKGVQKEVEGAKEVIQKKSLIDLLNSLKPDMDAPQKDDNDFFEMAKKLGVVFPRPRWWPPEGYDL